MRSFKNFHSSTLKPSLLYVGKKYLILHFPWKGQPKGLTGFMVPSLC